MTPETWAAVSGQAAVPDPPEPEDASTLPGAAPPVDATAALPLILTALEFVAELAPKDGDEAAVAVDVVAADPDAAESAALDPLLHPATATVAATNAAVVSLLIAGISIPR